MASSSSTSQVDGTAAVKSDEEIEEMLDRMLTRLALCDDSRLQSLLSNLLPLTISSLSSPSLSIRKKVLEILSHVNKRVKYRVEIGLPLLELWKLYSGSTAFAMVRNFCVVYIEMAFERASAEEKHSMASMLLANVSKLPNQHQDIILRIVTQVIGECHSNRIDDGAATEFSKISSEDRDVFLEFCLHTILYQPRQACPPGLSIVLADRVTGKKALDGDVLLKRKLGILNVIEAMELPAELVYSIYVCASADSQEPVIKRGEGLVKKKASSANLDDPNLVNRLFTLFNGPTVTGTVAPESKVQPGNITLRMKLLSIFCRSITAANSFPSTLQCIFGCMYGSTTTPRLKQMGMEFTVWVFKHARIDQLKLMGPLILKGILKSLDGASNSETDPFGRDTKTFAFQAIGLLAPRMPELFRNTIDMAVRLFDALRSESQTQRLVIQEATNSLATAYKSASSAVLRSLENLLLSSYHAEQSEVRFCVVRWATSLYDLHNCPSRFLCMLGAADSKLDIREMALEGLFPGKDDVNRALPRSVDLNFPRLREMLDYIFKQQPKLLDSTEVREQNLFFPSKMYVAMIKFLLKCFEAEFEQDNTTLAASEFQSSVKTMCSLLEHGMAYEGSVELHSNAAKGLVTIASHLPELIASRYAVKISFLKQLLNHVDFDTRESTARLLGIASSAFSISESCALLSELKSSAGGVQNLRFEIQHGVLSATGYVAADFVSRIHSAPETLQDTLKFLVGVVNSETATLASVAMEALGHIGLRIQLPLIVHDSSSVQILTALSEKLSKLLSGDDIKAIQRTVISLGHLCMNETSSSQFTIALNLIFGLCRSKVEDILFAAGEALSFLWGGVPVSADEILRTNYNSLSMSSKFLTGDLSSSLSKYRSSEESESHDQYHALVRDTITRKLFDDLLYSSRKEERCAGTVWLLSLTMYCGQHSTIQGMLPEIQEAFSHLLGEQNELTQELASQGMSIVYELGDETMKKNLVNALVGTLTGAGKRKRAIKLVEDSEVFQEGSIGEGLNGGKLNTYKELCGLANEMGQPDLIYKFMDLANYQASLNSKRGAAFGFSKIAKQAGDALQPHLRLLVPRLVRYQYDPDKNVQDAMAHIWKSLVADPKKTLHEYFDLVVEDLLVQSGSRLWRSREASCLALADIIQGRRFDQVGKHLKQIWVAAFRAMDDIKETVRKSGDNLCRAVTTLTIRLCDVSLTEKSEASNTMTIVLPFLLAEGILSKVDSIRKASIGIVMKLAKGAGIAIRPHLPDLVCCMLESLSSLEDQGMNYVELHADKVGIQTDKLENLRISIAKGSPMWETLDLCIKVIDTQSLDLLVPRLAQLVRSGVGLNTRVGVANFISSLLQKVHGDIKPFSSMLLRLLFPVVRDDKSVAVKRAFASACGMVLKYAAPSQAQKLIEDTAALHAGDRNAQIACAVLLKSYSSVATDVISGYQAVLVPAIFIARFEDDKYVSGLYEELWEENTSSERVTLQLYIEEIVSLICESIRSSSWASKKKAAQAIVKLSEVLGESLSFHHHILLESVMVEIHGRLWEGKEALLHAIGALSTSGHKEISDKDPATPSAILSLVTTACKKKVKKYREAAFGCLEQVIKAFSNPEFFIMVFPLLHEMIVSATGSKPGKVHVSSDVVNTETEEVEDFSAPHDKVLNCITSCIHVGDLKSIIEQKKNLIHVFLSSLSPGSLWNAKLAVFSAINEVSSRIRNKMDDSQETILGDAAISFIQELFDSVSPEVVECLKTVKIAQVHIAASECLLEMTKLYCSLPSDHQTDIGFRDELVFQHEVEKNEQAKSLLQKCIDSLESLKQESAGTMT